MTTTRPHLRTLGAGIGAAALVLALAVAATAPAHALAKHHHHHGGKRRYDVTYTGTEHDEFQRTCNPDGTPYSEHSTIDLSWNLRSTPSQQIVATKHGVDAGVFADQMDGGATEHSVYTTSLPDRNFDDTDPNATAPGAVRDGLGVTDGKHAIGAQSVDYSFYGGLDDEIPIGMNLRHLKSSYTLQIDGHAPGVDIGFGCTGTSSRSINATWDINQVSHH